MISNYLFVHLFTAHMLNVFLIPGPTLYFICVWLCIYYTQKLFFKSMRGNVIECFLISTNTLTTRTNLFNLNPRLAPYQTCELRASYYLLWFSSLSHLCLPHRSYHLIRKYFCASFHNRLAFIRMNIRKVFVLPWNLPFSRGERFETVNHTEWLVNFYQVSWNP